VRRGLAFEHKIQVDTRYVSIAAVCVVVEVFLSDINAKGPFLALAKLIFVVLVDVSPGGRFSRSNWRIGAIINIQLDIALFTSLIDGHHEGNAAPALPV